MLSKWQTISKAIDTLDSYRYIRLTDDHLKGYSDAGPREKLSPNGDNLPNVLYYLHTRHPETLAKITAQMRRWVPSLADIVSEITSDERLLLRFKDAPFEKPLSAQYMSDGTMRLAALLTLLYEPDAAGLLGIEEPENELHPQLLAYLAEELIAATETRQLLVATHSPALLNALTPEQVWVLHKGTDGYTQATRTADLSGIAAMVEEGTPLGYLWSRNFFDVGNPLHFPTPVQ
jgi:predicted ATPase